MALARAFTAKRSKRQEAPVTEPQRSISTRNASGKTLQRAQISAPVELLSTTNMLSFNAPDIHASSPSSNSGDDSDTSQTYLSSAATSIDGSPVESQNEAPEPNHLSCYFRGNRSNSNSSSTRKSDDSSNTPSVPQRVPSHTTANHQALARKRSLKRASPPPTSLVPNTPVSTTETCFSPHPFGKELEQVDELAEEYGLANKVLDEEELFMQRNGLMKFGVQDYMSEIESLFGGVFEDAFLPMNTGWI